MNLFNFVQTFLVVQHYGGAKKIGGAWYFEQDFLALNAYETLLDLDLPTELRHLLEGVAC